MSSDHLTPEPGSTVLLSRLKEIQDAIQLLKDSPSKSAMLLLAGALRVSQLIIAL